MNYQELKKLIDKQNGGEDSDATGIAAVLEGYESDDFPACKEVSRNNNDGEVTKVLHFPESNIFIKVSGYYSSYNGYEWDSFRQVFPKEKTITVYE